MLRAHAYFRSSTLIRHTVRDRVRFLLSVKWYATKAKIMWKCSRKRARCTLRSNRPDDEEKATVISSRCSHHAMTHRVLHGGNPRLYASSSSSSSLRCSACLVGEKKRGISRANEQQKRKKQKMPKSRDIFRQTRNRVTNSMPVIHEARRHANGMRASRWRWIKHTDQSAIVPAPAHGSPCERCHVTSRFKSKARAERGETSNRHHHHLRRFAPTDMARDVTTSWLRSTNGAPLSRVHIPRLPVASYSIFMWISVQICPFVVGYSPSLPPSTLVFVCFTTYFSFFKHKLLDIPIVFFRK